MTPRKGWRPMRRPLGDPGADIETELRLHLEGRVEEFLAAGMTEAAARAKAHKQFGDLDAIAKRCREEKESTRRNRSRKGPEFVNSILQDVRYAVRALIKRPGYTAAVLTTLVLAIGATTAVFSVVNGVLLHPLPHPDPQQLVMVWEVDQRPGFFDDHNRVTVANYSDWKEQNRVFENIAAFQTFPITFRGDGDPEQVLTGIVSADFFKTLGVNAAIGRAFLPEEDLPGQNGVVLLSHDFWRTRFAGDSTIVGKDVRIGSATASVVGVLPVEFDFQDQKFGMWIPLRLTESAFQNRRSHTTHVVARMKSDVTLDMAQRDMDRVLDGLRETYPQFLSGWGVNVTSLTDEVIGDIRPALLVLLGAVAFVLLIASVNVANLMLARSSGEHREVAVRTALGAARKRLMQQKLTESLVLSITGGVLGVLVAGGATKMLLAVAPQTLPHVEQIGLDIR
ncbi:MAG: ABC transporter permease, partial [Gemmatimonadetes bacterium]|nr:ABC transporter permease [Gemmatimonadota bacterium]